MSLSLWVTLGIIIIVSPTPRYQCSLLVCWTTRPAFIRSVQPRRQLQVSSRAWPLALRAKRVSVRSTRALHLGVFGGAVSPPRGLKGRSPLNILGFWLFWPPENCISSILTDLNFWKKHSWKLSIWTFWDSPVCSKYYPKLWCRTTYKRQQNKTILALKTRLTNEPIY